MTPRQSLWPACRKPWQGFRLQQAPQALGDRGPVDQEGARLHLGGKTLLLVDDEPDVQRLLRRMLSSAERGYRVLRAADGRQALSILSRQRPDVILFDLVMQNMDGFQFLEAKKADSSLCNIPTIILSARNPAGQLVLSNALAATCGGGLSVPQMLCCIEALTRILSTPGQPAVAS